MPLQRCMQTDCINVLLKMRFKTKTNKQTKKQKQKRIDLAERTQFARVHRRHWQPSKNIIDRWTMIVA
jgi:hypothetical protein